MGSQQCLKRYLLLIWSVSDDKGERAGVGHGAVCRTLNTFLLKSFVLLLLKSDFSLISPTL